MPTRVYNDAKRAVLAALLTSYDDLRIALLMTNTTADTENDGIQFVSQFTTLDEFNGANYVRKALTGEVAAVDDANDRAGLDTDNVTFVALGAGTRSIAGVLLYDHRTNDADSPVVAFLEFATPKTPDGTDFTLNITDIIRAL